MRTQPRHTLAELDALAEIVDLLDHCDNHDLLRTGEIRTVAQKFAARYSDIPSAASPDPDRRLASRLA